MSFWLTWESVIGATRPVAGSTAPVRSAPHLGWEKSMVSGATPTVFSMICL